MRKAAAVLAAATFRLRRGMARAAGAAGGDGTAMEIRPKDCSRLLAADMQHGLPNEAGHWGRFTMNGQMNSHRLWS